MVNRNKNDKFRFVYTKFLPVILVLLYSIPSGLWAQNTDSLWVMYSKSKNAEQIRIANEICVLAYRREVVNKEWNFSANSTIEQIHARVLYCMSSFAIAKGDYQKAVMYIKEGLSIDDLSMVADDYRNLAVVYDHINQISSFQIAYETWEKELRISSLEEEKRVAMLLSISGGGILLLGLVAVLLLWRWTVQKKQLAEQQVKQLEQEKQLIATQAVLDGEVQERTRLARDLHDGLGSILAAAKYSLTNIKKTAIRDAIDIECFDRAMNLLDESMREMRRMAHHLMPETLSRYGLKQSVTDFCNSIPHVKFTWYGDETRLEPKMEVMVYRIMHELVSNALKHSGASHILVEIVRYENNIALTVQDDGCGFDPSTVSKGMGLENIRTRVAAYNGNLLMDSKIGIGTEINVELRVES